MSEPNLAQLSRSISTVNRWLDSLDRWLILPLVNIALYGMMLLISYDVITRYFTGGSAFFIPPLTIQLLLPIIAYLALGFIAAEDGNIRVEVIVRLFPTVLRTLIRRFWSLLGAVMFFAIAYESMHQAIEYWGVRAVGVVVLPLSIPYFVVFIGATLGAARMLAQVLDPQLAEKLENPSNLENEATII